MAFLFNCYAKKPGTGHPRSIPMNRGIDHNVEAPRECTARAVRIVLVQVQVVAPRLIYVGNEKLNIDAEGHRIIAKGYSRANQWFRLGDSPRGIKSSPRSGPGIIKVLSRTGGGRERGSEKVYDNEAFNNRSTAERSSGPSQFKPILTISPDPILVLPSWRPTVWPIAAVHRSATTAPSRTL